MDVFDAQGKPVKLGQSIGRGGEAVVYQIAGRPGWLAKIYEPAPRAEYQRKLAWMIGHPPQNPTRQYEHAALAWPAGMLFDRKRHLAGYWMPYIQTAAPVLAVFNPRRRAETLPQFDRRYLLRTARNLAATLRALHHSGYVAGDLNESNVLVTPSALVTLIDTDSFQVQEERDGRITVYGCPVAKLEYTPPELQGKSLTQIMRQPEHDAFGLGVLIFQLLMEGSHPFRAQWLGAGEPPPLEARIASGAFPYTASPGSPVRPPARAPDLTTLHPRLAELVRRCFIDGHKDPSLRPTPEQWEQAIARSEKELVRCPAGHYYSGHLADCPRCPPRKERRTPERPAEERPASGPPAFGRGRWAGWASSRRPGPAPMGAPRSVSGAPRPAPAAPNISTATPSSTPNTPRPAGSNPAGASPAPSASPAGAPAGRSTGGAAPYTRPGMWTAPRPAARRPVWQPPGPPRKGAWERAREKMGKSLLVGGGVGALAGLLPGVLLGAASLPSGQAAAWSLLWTLGGVAGGLLRGWQPGYRLGSVVNRTIGWNRFWKGAGLAGGAMLGGAAGLVFWWAVFPVFLGLYSGARVGLSTGQRIWLAGNRYGWERIWAIVGGVGSAGVGGAAAWWAWASGLGGLTSGLAGSFGSWLIGQGASVGLSVLLVSALGGALGGLIAGVFADLVARFTGLTD